MTRRSSSGCGWVSLGATLARPGVSALADSIRPRERLQADLIAMARGFTMAVEPSSTREWLSVTFTRVRDGG